MIVDVLASHGHQVDTAADSVEALRRCEQVRYDLILSDLRMPKMDGADYAGILGVAGVPVLAKPFTVDELRHAVTQALGTEG